MKKLLISLTFFLLLINIVYGYPPLSFETGINHTASKELVYSIPEVYYKHVTSIEFVNKPINCMSVNNRTKCWRGWSWAYWDRNHRCYSGRIILQNASLLEHELGHIYWHCELKQSVLNETFAENFRIGGSPIKMYRTKYSIYRFGSS